MNSCVEMKVIILQRQIKPEYIAFDELVHINNAHAFGNIVEVAVRLNTSAMKSRLKSFNQFF